MSESTCIFRVAAWSVLLLGAVGACRRESSEEAKAREAGGAPLEQKAELVIFPSEVQAADAGVNGLVREALAHCAAGDYDAFRRLWTAKQDPPPRPEFEEGWQAVQRIRVRGLERVALADEGQESGAQPQIVYVLWVEVSLDPTKPAGQREANREIVLMLSQEVEGWRLARAPKAMREWVKNRAEGSPRRTDAKVPSNGTKPADDAPTTPGS